MAGNHNTPYRIASALTDVLVYADSIRSPEMRHEVPLAVPDPFLYAERDGESHVVVSSFEIDRINEVAPDLDTIPPEELGLDEKPADGEQTDEVPLSVVERGLRHLRYGRAVIRALLSVPHAVFGYFIWIGVLVLLNVIAYGDYQKGILGEYSILIPVGGGLFGMLVPWLPLLRRRGNVPE